MSLPAGDLRWISSLDGTLVTYDLHTPSNTLQIHKCSLADVPSVFLCLPEGFFLNMQIEMYAEIYSATYQSEKSVRVNNALNPTNIKTHTYF